MKACEALSFYAVILRAATHISVIAHDRCLQNPFKFIIHQSSCHSDATPRVPEVALQKLYSRSRGGGRNNLFKKTNI